jgi:uncharacterized metal-binding protein YceD (DUF177 family)
LTDFELSRPVSLSKIGPQGLGVTVLATPKECERIAARMDIPAIRSLECSLHLVREPGGVSVLARGRLRANLTRICVVSAEEFETTVDDEFEVRFVPAGKIQDDPDPNQIDEIPYETSTIDLGEATTEQLGLALDPYPRMDGAVVADLGDAEPEEPENRPQFSILTNRFGSSGTRH